jgi:2-polyprenyl-3-methyl-5-hydroxy-6-metoxy-1,4-benzoquinol methylase
MDEPELDEAKLEGFIEKLFEDAAATAHAATVVVGDKLGLYRALAEGGAQTALELARRTLCHPRMIQEWLNAQAASGYCVYEASTGRYRLNAEQAACLADAEGPFFLVGNMGIVSSIHKDVEGLQGAFAGETRLAWNDHHPDLFTEMARASSTDYQAALVPEWIPAVQGAERKLQSGARVADIGCGYGGPTIMLAEAYPASTFHGFDLHEGSIEEARKGAAEAGVSDRVTFEVAAAESIPGSDYDLICTFDAFHDMGRPVAVARRIRAALAEKGTWMIAELNAKDRVEDNANDFGRFLYSVSTFVCVPNALSQGNDRALGAAAGEAALRDVVVEADFRYFRRVAETPFNVIFEAQP